MKRSDKLTTTRGAAVLLWVFPLLLIVPNVIMSVASGMIWSVFASNVAIPLGIYLMLLAAWPNTGRSATLMMLPVAILAAFQIVLLALYLDGSVIAVDMFLNVVTTNTSEALELLGSLGGPVTAVIVLYLPPLAFAMWLWIKRRAASPTARNEAMKSGAAFLAAGLVCVIVSHTKIPHYRADYDIFPFNAICNLAEAVNRTHKTADYRETSADYTFGATSANDPAQREVYIAVVGETSRADHYQLLGYPRFTTPRLCETDSLIAYGHVLSESNTTHKSVPMLLSTIKSENFSDSIYCTKSVISAFKEAGFQTAFLSMQGRNGSFIDFFGAEADTTAFYRDSSMAPDSVYDYEVLPKVDSLMAAHPDGKLLVVVHLYGSHFNYLDRYPRHAAFFVPDHIVRASAENRETLINAYDNSIRMTDYVVSGLIKRLDSLGVAGGLIYTADHGEDIFDDGRGRFLHASPTPTFYQLHVPMILYFNGEYCAEWPEKRANAVAATEADISSSESFSHTLLHMAGIETPRLQLQSALTSGEFRGVDERMFLNDRNEAVSLARAGFTPVDFGHLTELNRSRSPRHSPRMHRR